MFSIIFLCHGNICRSPMAESVMAHLVRARGMEGEIRVSSAAAHTDAIGCAPHRGTREKLAAEHIPLVPHRAVLLTRADADACDLILCMDEANVRDAKRIAGKDNEGKVRLLLSAAGTPRAIADPWYTGDFDATFRDVLQGCGEWLSLLSGGGVSPHAKGSEK